MDMMTTEQPDIESSTQDYASRFSGPIGEWFLTVQEQGTERQISPLTTDPNQSLSILDAGGGHGQNIPWLVRNNHNITVLGSDKSCANLIQSFLQNDEVQFETGSLLSMPFIDQSYDVAISYRMLPHLNHWRQHIAELCRVSRVRVVVDFPTLYSINYFSDQLFSLKKGIEKNTRPFTLFREQDIVTEFARHGFSPVHKYPQFLLPMALYRALKKPKLAAMLEQLFRTSGLTQTFGSPVIYGFERNQQSVSESTL